MADVEAKQNHLSASALLDLHNKRDTLHDQVTKIQNTVNKNLIAMKRFQAALEYLEGVDDSTKTYKQLSRAFVLQKPSELRTEIKNELEKSENDKHKLKDVKSQLIAKLKEADEQLAEAKTALMQSLVASKKANK